MKPIKLVKSSFYQEQQTKQKLADFILRAKKFSMDSECKKFEGAFAKKQKRKFAVFTTSGSAANLILVQSLLNLGLLKKNDRVGVSALTWPTNIMPLIQLGLRPVLLDCELGTLNVSPRILKKYLPSLKGLFLTNVLGFCDDLTSIRNLCKKNKIIFFEDNCESLGSQMGSTLLGNFGLASTFSFFVGHHFSTIEGGMVCTDDKNLADMLVMVRAHGWDRNLGASEQKKLRAKYSINDFYGKYTFYDLAYNTRPTEIQGFLGNIQLGAWKKIIHCRQDNFKALKKAMIRNSDFIQMDLSHMQTISNFDMPVVCKNKSAFEKYKQRFLKNKVEIRPIIAGNMGLQPFYKKYQNRAENCPNATHIHKCGFYFPNNAELTDKQIEFMKSLLKK